MNRWTDHVVLPSRSYVETVVPETRVHRTTVVRPAVRTRRIVSPVYRSVRRSVVYPEYDSVKHIFFYLLINLKKVLRRWL